MANFLPAVIVRIIKLMTGLLILKVTMSIVLNYRNYFPPNFSSEFLSGRAEYFFGCYQWAFYSHILAGPITLILGLLLLNNRFRIRFPKWHRYLGRVQVTIILLMMLPSGLWMSFYAATGRIATFGFATLSIVTAAFAVLGWRAALKRRFKDHQIWMFRCYLALCSAVVLRLTAGLATVTDYQGDWIYPMAAWSSWLVPLAVYEFSRIRIRSGFLTMSSWKQETTL